MKLKYEHVYEDKISSVLARIAFEQSFADQDLSLKFMNLSTLANNNTLKKSPQNLIYWKTRASNYYLYYQVTHDQRDLDQAVISMRKAMLLAPTDAQTMYTLAVFYKVAADESKNVERKENFERLFKSKLEETIRLKPNYQEALELTTK